MDKRGGQDRGGMSSWDVKLAGAEKNLEVDVVVAVAVAVAVAD
jgi:hypothetical protein